jgi:hypothetical protein
MPRPLSALACVLLVVCCASTRGERCGKDEAALMGHTAQELIAKWGPPSAVLPNSGGGRMIVYLDQSPVTMPGPPESKPSLPAVEATASADQVPTYLSEKPANGPQVYKISRERVFYVDQHGVIYRCELMQGAGMPEQPHFPR